MSDLVKWDLSHNSVSETWAGIDEVGRGCLAGPVVACCIILNHQVLRTHPDIFNQARDSKKISPKKREHLAKIFENILPFIGYGIVDCIGIDRDNILQASLSAMRQAAQEISLPVNTFYIDGTTSPELDQTEVLVPQGDDTSCSIAVASILAKVYRDRLMQELGQQYPRYGFHKHKGYGTREHLRALDLYGASPIHRLTFEPVRNRIQEDLRIFQAVRDTLCATQSESDLASWFHDVFRINYGKMKMERVETLRNIYLERLVSLHKESSR